ncbi:MAG: hypothetical protein ABIO68_00255 [Sphingomicrobium sp.]
MNNKIFAVFAILALASCKRDQPPTPTSEQAGQLDEAEDMLNAMDKKEGAAPTGTAPPQSNGT